MKLSKLQTLKETASTMKGSRLEKFKNDLREIALEFDDLVFQEFLDVNGFHHLSDEEKIYVVCGRTISEPLSNSKELTAILFVVTLDNVDILKLRQRVWQLIPCCLKVVR